MQTKQQTLVIGAGPAGLSAAYELSRSGWPVTVLERDPHQVGGLSRTLSFDGFRFDIGGHRFFSKNAEIEALWSRLLGDRLLTRDRLSRIHYRGTLFRYPIEPFNALRRLGLAEACACLLSYARARALPPRQVHNFEDWMVRAFGRRLYEIFFKTYTEKVWGIPCNEISADWAAQRIQDLSFAALLRAVLGAGGRPTAKTLVDRFRYPRLGPGEMWDACAAAVRAAGGVIQLGHSVERLSRDTDGQLSVRSRDAAGNVHEHAAQAVVSTMPLRELAAGLHPVPPEAVQRAAAGLRYRDYLTAAVVVEAPEVFPDQWIYVHDPGVRVGRIQNFKNWSPDMVSDARRTLLGLEYFCAENDSLWGADDAEILALAARELRTLGLIDGARIAGGTVVRQAKAYPVYDHTYSANVDTIRRHTTAHFPGLHVAGRNGMHKYDNQDHAMLTGILAARNVMGGSYDVWRVNTDAEYLEEAGSDSGLRLVPARLRREPPASAEA